MELRPHFVGKYVQKVMERENEEEFKKKIQVVKKMLELNVDNRTLNQMRETLNCNIEDENGLMKTSDFKKMLFTAYGQKNQEKTE